LFDGWLENYWHCYLCENIVGESWQSESRHFSFLKGLFQRAILISGSVLSPFALQRRPEDVASQVAAHLGCVGRLPLSHPESDLAPCLRRKHLSDLLNFVPDSPRFLPPFAPFVDNILIRNPKSMMEGELSEHFLRSQILFMFTTSEGVHELSSSELKNGFESDHRDRILRTLVRNVFTFHQQEIFSIVRNEYTGMTAFPLYAYSISILLLYIFVLQV